ncbi:MULTISPECIES: phage tail tape measure protein [unclassified Streptomyces]|uniref:phage tail tape measure protein n=1 Tax=unclassified Streptomyces TaxID=2593676 RepID=UPI001E4DE144|nr:phage tail tape measure protein [Streptomyces sp. CB02980]MCB8906787.1 phage tail tape measure protein [Streptomyces sp. CB02980]
MAGAYTLYVHVQAGVTGLVGGLRTAAGQVTAFGSQVRRLDGDLNQLAGRSEQTRRAMAAGFAVMGVALGGAFVLGVRGAIELEKQMANVMTISKEINNTNISNFTDQIVELSTQLPQSASQLAEGLYQVVSTGFDGADAMTILRVAARGAAAGLTTTETSARALLGVLKAYGMDASQAADVMDVMFQTVNYGVVSFDELAQQLGDVVPMAAAAGVEFDDISSALAAVTLTGIPAAEAVTALNMLMTRMMKPGRELVDMIKGFGYESAAAALEQDGLYVVMEKVRNATGGSADQLVPLLKDIRAVRAVLALSAAEGKNYQDTYAGISIEVERAGATQRAYAIQLDTTAGQWAQFQNQAQALGIDMARVLLPALESVGEVLNIVAGAINDLPGPAKSLMGVVLALSAAALLAKAAFLRFGNQLTIFRTELATARAGGSALPAVLSGAGIAVAGLTALMAIGVGVYAAYSASKQKAKAATEELVDALRREREEGEQGAGLRTLTEQLTNSDDVKKLKDAQIDVATAIDAITSGGAKLTKLKDELDIQKGLTWDRGSYAADPEWDAAKKVLDRQHEVWSNAVKKENELAASMAIVNNKIKANRQELLGAWELTQSLPTDKNGSPKFTEQMEAMGKALGSIVDPAKAWKNAQDKVAEANKKAGLSADASKASLSDYVEELNKQLKAQREFQKNLGELAANGRLDLADHFAALGPESAPLLDELVGQLRKGKGEVADELEKIIQESSARATPAFRAGLEQLPAISAKYGRKVAEAWADASATNDPGKFAKVMQDMVVADMGKAAKKLPKAAAAQMEQGMSVLADVSEKFGKEASTSLAQSFLTGDIENIRSQLGFLYGADMPIDAPDLSAVVAAFRTAGRQSNSEWLGMLSLIVSVSQTKGSEAASALTTALLSGDMAAVQAQLDEIGASVGRIPGQKTITVSVNKPAAVTIPFFAKIQASTWDKDGNGVPDGIQKVPVKQANGGLLDFYADGGVRTLREDHTAQIAPAGAWRVWAEPETQGEAYIPLAGAKRGRSKRILEDVARRFGGEVTYHADGGVTGFNYQAPALYTLSGIAGDSMNRKGKFSLSLFADKLDASVATAKRWRKDLETVARRAGQDVANSLAEMGVEGIALTRKMATGSSRYVRAMAGDLEALAAASRASLGEWSGQLRQAAKDQSAFERNLSELEARGYGALAKRLREQGDQDAADLADQAVRDPKKAKAANDAAARMNAALVANLQQWTNQLGQAAKDRIAFERNLSKLEARGYGALAKRLREQGDQDAADLAAQAVKDSKKAKAANDEATRMASALITSLGQWTDQLRKTVKDQNTFEQNVAKLAASGYTDLAKNLAEQGDEEAAALAAQAVKDPKKAKAANDAARTASKALPEEDLPDLVAIIGAIKSKTTGLHVVADATGLSEERIIEIANLGLARLKSALGAKGTKFFDDLRRANRGLSYASGGILTPGLYATSGGLIKFAEPETGGEAFIPLGAAKRGSALAVLQDVATRFGMRLSSADAVPAPTRLVDARPSAAIKVTIIQQHPKALVESMPITVHGRDTSPQELSGEIMRRLRNAQRGGRI